MFDLKLSRFFIIIYSGNSSENQIYIHKVLFWQEILLSKKMLFLYYIKRNFVVFSEFIYL